MSDKPRKRKDKKKKDSVSDAAEIARRLSTREDSDAGESTTPSGVQSMEPDDVQLHVHKDHGTGGHWCAKIVFFALLAILAGLVGLIILENRGLSDLDTPLSESRFSEILEGWVEENRESHDDHDEHEILASLEELEEHDEHDEPFEEEEDHEEEGGEAEDDEEEDDHGEEDDEEADDEDQEEEDQEDEDQEDEDEEADAEDDEGQDEDVDEGIDDGDDNTADDDDDDDENKTNEDEEDDEPDTRGPNTIDDEDDDNDNDNENDEDDDDDDQPDNDNDDDDDDQPNNDDDDDDAPFEEQRPTNINNPVPLTQMSDTTEKTDTVTVADLDVQIEAMKIAYDEVAQQLGKPSFNELKVASQECPIEDFSTVETIKLDDDGSQEDVIDNDAGEDLHLKKLAQKDEPEPDDTDDQLASPSSSQIPPKSGAQSLEDDLQSANDDIEDNPRSALKAFDGILKKSPRTPEALYGRARALDRLSEMQQSNAILKDAIKAYEAVLRQKANVSDDLFTAAATRCIDRMRFLGLHTQAMPIHEALIHRFDDQPVYRNQKAISHLLLNQLADAKLVLHHTLLRWRHDPVALVHYGFVLKALDQDYEDAALYLTEGLATNAEGTQDGRFYFALGDSLMRLGKRKEAHGVFRLGAKKKLFLSQYQRSLYNVETLKSRPFWTIDETKNRQLFETLEINWKLIRDEGMKLLNQEGFFVDEAENLREKGDWKQLDLFVKGQKIAKHCQKAPLTCNIMESFPAARFCTRGQVKFSVMHPGTHVWPHCGPTNCRIRAHLGLKVPPGTSIRVAEETRSWQEGKMLIFDDSFEHEVWHNGTGVRLVLIVDIWHPDLTEEQRRSLHPI